MNLHPLDIVFIVLLAVAAIRCAFRGFVAEVMSMAAILLGVGGAVLFANPGALLIDEYVGYSSWNQIIAFLVIFLAVYIVVKLLEGLLRRLLEKIHLDRLDKALGFFLGLAEGVLVVVLLVYLMSVQPILEIDEFLQGSWIARFVMDVAPASGGGVDATRAVDV